MSWSRVLRVIVHIYIVVERKDSVFSLRCSDSGVVVTSVRLAWEPGHTGSPTWQSALCSIFSEGAIAEGILDEMDYRRDYKASEVAKCQRTNHCGKSVDIDLFAMLNKGTNEARDQDWRKGEGQFNWNGGLTDKTVRLWDAVTGAALQTLEGRTRSAQSPSKLIYEQYTNRLWSIWL